MQRSYSYIEQFVYLMRTTDQVQLVSIQKLRDNIHTEGEAHTAIVFAPTLNILVGIAPEQITQ